MPILPVRKLYSTLELVMSCLNYVTNKAVLSLMILLEWTIDRREEGSDGIVHVE